MLCSALLLLPLSLDASPGAPVDLLTASEAPVQEGGRLVARGDARVDTGEHLHGDVVSHTFVLDVVGTDSLRVQKMTPT